MAEAPLFAIPVADLDYGDRDIDEEIPVAWLENALSGTEAVPQGHPGRLEVTVSKTGRDVMARGRARAAVTMPCARTLDPVKVDIDAEVFLLLHPGTPAGPAKHEKPRRKRQGQAPAAAPEKPLAESEAAEDIYDGEKVVLDGFIQEFLVLELPMFPLREDLRSEAAPAIERPPEKAAENRSGREAIDPRLAPLAAIASRLRDKKE